MHHPQAPQPTAPNGTREVSRALLTEAAAWDYGWGDGEMMGYKLGLGNLARINHEPTAFHGLSFPDPTYAQIYNNAFCTAIQSGYDRGHHDWKMSFIDQDMYYKETKKWCDIASSFGTLVAILALLTA